jgi:hypothetical protein
MASTFLDTPVLDNGLRYVNFFNGRQLSAEDLERERDATRRHQQRLGVGVGSAIIDGLHVIPLEQKDAPRLRIARGSAVNRQGQVLSLPQDVEIELRARPPATPALTVPRDDAGLFGECGEPSPPATVTDTSEFGVQVLLIGPSSGMRERVPKIGLRDEGVAARCDFAWVVEGVQFTIHRLDPAAMRSLTEKTRKRIPSAGEIETLSLLRDIVAHAFLGTEDVVAHYANLLRREQQESPMVSYGEMDALWKDVPRLACDVPLALLFWSQRGIEFVDLWSVRRPLTPRPLSRTSPVATSERRAAEGEATLFHFQEHLAWLAGKVKDRLIDIDARRYFGYLPAVGIVPLPAAIGTGPGLEDVAKLKFFAGCTLRRPAFIAEHSIEPLLRQSLAYLPIDLRATDDRGKPRPELVWVYQVRENHRESERTKTERYLVFASGHMPYAGHARCDLSWWDFSNYSSVRLGAPGA